MSDQRSCESCGMPLQSAEDFGGGLLDNKYCVHCTDEGGNLRPYEQVLENLKGFAIRTMGVPEEEALQIAQEGLSRLPAWRNQSE